MKWMIAVVEDDEEDRFFIESGLKGLGKNFWVKSFCSGIEFLTYLEEKKELPDIIITDIRMPLVSGFDVIQKVKKESETKNIPVFVLSTSSDEEDREMARGLGALDYFVKPTSLEEYESIGTRIVKSSGKTISSLLLMVKRAGSSLSALNMLSCLRPGFQRGSW